VLKTSHPRSYDKSHVWGAKTLEGIAIKFGMPTLPSDVHDVVTHANFCQDWSKGFSVAKGRILAFSIDLRGRLYNTLALPCECVI